MAKFSTQDRILINEVAGRCLNNRFYDSHRIISHKAGLTSEQAELPKAQLRMLINYNIGRGTMAPVIGELLRIENTFMHARDIEQYNQEQASAIIRHMDATLPLLDNKNLWLATHKMKNIFHHTGRKAIEYTINEQPTPFEQIKFINHMLKSKKNPLLNPNYTLLLRQELSAKRIGQIDHELKNGTNNEQKIALNEEKIFMIDNTGWNRSKKFLNKSNAYQALSKSYTIKHDFHKAKAAEAQYDKFLSAYEKSLKFSKSLAQKQAQDEWNYR